MFSFNIRRLWIAFLLLGINSLLCANTAAPYSLIEIQKPVLKDSIVANVIHTDKLYVAVGENTKTQTPLILISPDGKKWASQKTKVVNGSLSHVIYANNQYVVVGKQPLAEHSDLYFPLILTSPDALQWTALAESVPALVGSLKSVSYGNGGYVAIGETWFRDPTDPTRAWMMNAPLILNSPDGIHWTIEQSSIRKGKLNQIIYKDKNFIATGEAAIKRDNGDTDSLLTLTSADGIHWKSAFSEKKIS